MTQGCEVSARDVGMQEIVDRLHWRYLERTPKTLEAAPIGGAEEIRQLERDPCSYLSKPVRFV